MFESALGGSSLMWRHIQALASGFARACAYDRAGFGWSEAGPLPRTAGQIVAELAALLDAANIQTPIVLVGHSFGGLTARLFASRYPHRVAGLVLLDPACPEDWRVPSRERSALIGRATALCRHGRRAARLGLTNVVVALVRLGALDVARRVGRVVSFGDFTPADEHVLVPAGKLPADVLDVAVRSWTHARFFDALGSQIASISQSARELPEADLAVPYPLVVISRGLDANLIEQDRHAALAATSASGQHLVAEGSGHWIPLDRPDLVIEAIRRTVLVGATIDR